MVHRAARAFECSHVVLVKAKKPLELLMAIMEIGSQVFVEFRAGVDRILLPKRHSGVEAALDALEVELLHGVQFGVDCGGKFGGELAVLFTYELLDCGR